MPTESFNETIVQQLVDTATGIKRRTFETKGAQLTSPVALGQAFLSVGRTYLIESLKLMREGNVATSMDYYLNNMPPIQAEQFAVGTSLGILGCVIATIDHPEEYLTNFNNYITGTPLPSEPTPKYKEFEEIFRSHIEPDNQRLRKLITEDPTLTRMVSDPENFPFTTKIHLFTLDPVIKINIKKMAAPAYKTALAILEGDQPSREFHTPDQDWLEGLGNLLKDL